MLVILRGPIISGLIVWRPIFCMQDVDILFVLVLAQRSFTIDLMMQFLISILMAIFARRFMRMRLLMT